MTHGKDTGPQVFVERRSIVGGPFFGVQEFSIQKGGDIQNYSSRIQKLYENLHV